MQQELGHLVHSEEREWIFLNGVEPLKERKRDPTTFGFLDKFVWMPGLPDFFLVQHTKEGKNIPTDHKICTYTKWPKI
jgi:hypothetical protein